MKGSLKQITDLEHQSNSHFSMKLYIFIEYNKSDFLLALKKYRIKEGFVFQIHDSFGLHKKHER